VPYIFESQIDAIIRQFGSTPYQRIEIEVALPESLFAARLTAIQAEFDDVEIGSYPGRCGPDPCGKICLSGQDSDRLNRASQTVNTMLDEIKAKIP